MTNTNNRLITFKPAFRFNLICFDIFFQFILQKNIKKEMKIKMLGKLEVDGIQHRKKKLDDEHTQTQTHTEKLCQRTLQLTFLAKAFLFRFCSVLAVRFTIHFSSHSISLIYTLTLISTINQQKSIDFMKHTRIEKYPTIIYHFYFNRKINQLILTYQYVCSQYELSIHPMN